MTMNDKKMKKTLLLICLPALLLSQSCHKQGQGSAGPSVQVGNLMAGESGSIVITRAQFESAGMVLGEPVPMVFSNEITANGYLVSSISGSAKISPMVPGRVSKIFHRAGESIRKGDALFSLEGTEIIMLQQEYAEAFNQLHLVTADYERIKALSEEGIVAGKEFLKSESDFRSMQAKVEGLKLRLKMLHIDTDLPEQGHIVPSIIVPSPIGGVITWMDLVIGQSLEPQVTVIEVVDTEDLRLNFRVFEQDLDEIRVGQQVLFSIPDHPETEYKATVSHVGRSIDPETRNVQCLARIDPWIKGTFVNNLYVQARVVVQQREAMAIPEEALLTVDGKHHVLILSSEEGDRMIFEKIPVNTGITLKGFTEVLDEGLSGILLQGVYNIGSE